MMFVSFINVFTRIRKVMVSCQGLYAVCCRSFYVKPALFNELHFTLQTDFAARCCFWLSANDSSIEQICPPVLKRSFVSGIVKKRALNQNKNTNIIAYRNAGNCSYSQNFGAPRNRVP